MCMCVLKIGLSARTKDITYMRPVIVATVPLIANNYCVYNYKALPLDGDPPFFLFTPFFLAIKMLPITACLAMLAVV